MTQKSREPKLTFAQWWRAEELGRKPHELLDNHVKQLEDDQQGRYEAYREYERLFGTATSISGPDDNLRAVASDELIQNELQNTIETLWAQIYKNKIVPAVSVSEADWEEWDRARSYSRWLEGAFDEAKVHEEVFPQAGGHHLIYGTGFIRVGWEETGEKTAKVKAWAVNPKYILVDRLEARHGRPRSVFFKDHIDRYVLYSTYGKKDKDFFGTAEERQKGIEDCTANDDQDLGYASTTKCDMLTVREGFHLPSSATAKDGRHVIWIRGCTLLDEPFSWDTFPFVAIRFGIRIEGFYGDSAVKRIAPTQKNLDKLNKKLDEAQDIMGVPRIIVTDGVLVSKQHIDDIPGGILSVQGSVNSIKDWNAQCATPELYNDRDAAPRKMRSLLGVSDFEAQQQIPQGMRDVSGAMLERWIDQGQARHAMDHGQYENAVPELAYLFMRQAEDLQAMGYDLVVKGPTEAYSSTHKSSIERLSFKDVHIDRERLKVRVQPMSQLPQTFGGKVEAIEKLRKAEVPLDGKTALRMLEIPDVSGATDMLVSDEEIIFKNLTFMCKKGLYTPPMPFDNLDLIIQMTTRFINHYRIRDDADYKVVGLLAQYIDDAVKLQRGLGSPDQNAPPPVPSTMGALGVPPPQGVPFGATGTGMMPPPEAMGMPPMGPPGPPPMDPMTGPSGQAIALQPSM